MKEFDVSEKSPCDDCSVRVLRESRVSISATDAALRHYLGKKVLGIDTPSGGLEDDALDRCRHWHRWAEALGMGEEVVISLKKIKETRDLPEK